MNVATQKPPVIISEDLFAEYVERHGFDFADFGCSNGGSLQLGIRRFGGQRGLGIDISDQKVSACVSQGLDAINYDIHRIPAKKLFRFTLMSHFLEHIPVRKDVAAFLRRACDISTEFVFIQQPFFDCDGYLARHGLKLYWSDWKGHPNHMTSLDLWLLLREIQQSGEAITFSIFGRGKICSSDDHCIIPLGSPTDQHHYDLKKHPAKPPSIQFSELVCKELICIITLQGSDHAQHLTRYGMPGDFPLALPEVNASDASFLWGGFATRVGSFLRKGGAKES